MSIVIVMGPVLGFRGVEELGGTPPRWCVGVLVVVRGDADPVVTAEGAAISDPVVLMTHAGHRRRRRATHRVLRYDLAVEQVAEARAQTYRIDDGTEHVFQIPARSHPPRIAFASCNGFSDPKLMKSVEDKNERWTHMATHHADAPYHLLVMGGDQVYADQIWATEPFESWAERPRAERLKRSFNKKKQANAAKFYSHLYETRWAQPEVAAMLASVPTLMMWDDHDIFDGWGSYSDVENKSPVFQGLFGVAREHFAVFQRQTLPGTPAAGELPNQAGFSYGHIIGDTAILSLDLRSERTNGRVMSKQTWRAAITWMDALPEGVRHLLVVSSIPVVYPDFTTVERLLGVIPGRQELEDDLRDHWHSPPHKQERVRLIQRMLDLSSEKHIRVTILSGDVHVAAVGVIQSERGDAPRHANVVTQLTSSGIVHPPPPAIAVWAFENLVASKDEPIRGVTTRLMELPGASRKLIAARNWLAIEPDDVGVDGSSRRRLWVNWHVEGETSHAYTKVIHAVGR